MSTSLKATSPHFESPYPTYGRQEPCATPRTYTRATPLLLLTVSLEKGTAIRVEIDSRSNWFGCNFLASPLIVHVNSVWGGALLTVTYLFGFRRLSLVENGYDLGRRFVTVMAVACSYVRDTEKGKRDLIGKYIKHTIRGNNKPVYFIRWNIRIINFSFSLISCQRMRHFKKLEFQICKSSNHPLP